MPSIIRPFFLSFNKPACEQQPSRHKVNKLKLRGLRRRSPATKTPPGVRRGDTKANNTRPSPIIDTYILTQQLAVSSVIAFLVRQRTPSFPPHQLIFDNFLRPFLPYEIACEDFLGHIVHVTPEY